MLGESASILPWKITVLCVWLLIRSDLMTGFCVSMAEVLISENHCGYIIAFEFICFLSSQVVNYIKLQKLIVKLRTAAV